MTGRVVGGPSTSGGGAGGGGGVGGGGGDGGKKRCREKQASHDQSEAVFKDDGDERASRKRDIVGEVMELLHKNEAGGGRTRAMDLQALVSQQSTMTNTITSLLQHVQLLKNSLRQAEDSDEVQELEDKLQDVNQSRKAMRVQLRDLDEGILKETIVVARERNEVVEQEDQEQMKRRAGRINSASEAKTRTPGASRGLEARDAGGEERSSYLVGLHRS